MHTAGWVVVLSYAGVGLEKWTRAELHKLPEKCTNIVIQKSDIVILLVVVSPSPASSVFLGLFRLHSVWFRLLDPVCFCHLWLLC